MPCGSKALRISSPIGPSITLRMCSTERNRKGRPGTAVSGIRLLSGARLIRFMSMTPKRVCSIVSFSSPSWREWNTWILMRPLVRLSMSLPISFTASTVG